MNLPEDFPELEVLLEKMEARFQVFKPVIDIQLQHGSVPVLPDEFDAIDNQIPTIQNRKAIFYISDAWTYKKNAEQYGWRNKEPRYHVVNCEKLQEMKEKERFGQYRATRRTDGKFPVTFSFSDELRPLKLVLCKYCLTQLKKQYGEGVFPKNPMEFPLADWLETFDYEEGLDRSEFRDVPFDYLSEAWRERSLACREKVNWTCQKCNTNLETDRHLLHAHHQWGTKFNDPEDLMALCISCHAKQDGDGHQLLKHYPEYQEFMEKYRGISRSGIELNAPYQPSRRSQQQQQPTPTHLQATVTEDDIPF